MLARLAVGFAVLGALYWVSIWTQPLWDRDAFHWAYTETTTPAGQRLALSIKAKKSNMGSITGVSFTPTLYVICEQQHVYVEMDTTRPLCIGPCGELGTYSTFEYFVTDVDAPERERERGEWYFTGAAPTRAKHFYEVADDPGFAAKDVSKAIAFVQRLAAVKEYRVSLGSAEFAVADFADQLPRLRQACPLLE
jgi:hypothetical protein